jgi:phosphate transport system permease protein
VILPAARAGIFGASILALGRALAETVAVTMVIGNRYEIPPSIFSPAYTLASVIANEFTEATGDLYISSLVELGLVLILVTLTVNVVALLLVRSAQARVAI